MGKVARARKILLGTAFILVVLGLVMLTSISIPLSQQNFGESYYYFSHQLLFGFGVGLFLLLIFRKLPPTFFKKIALPFFLVTIGLLVLVQIPAFGYEVGGARRWLGLAGLSFQPSELAKLALIIYMAAWLDKRSHKVGKMSSLPAFLVIVGLVAGLIIIQPDLGTTALIVAVALIMYLIAGAKWRAILAVVLVGVILASAFAFTQPYVKERVLGFLDPSTDTQNKGYQLTQALITIGSGGAWGRGLGHSVQKYQYLPEAIGDSVFAIIAEEIGFVGASAVVVIYLLFIVAGIRIARASPTNFGAFLVVGIVSWIGLQAFLNIGGITRLIPFTGIPLPFVSYGGTALAIELAAIGIISSVARRS